MSLDTELSNEQKLRALSLLIESDGWKLYCEMLDASKQAAIGRVLAAKDAHQMAVSTGIYKAIQFQKEWPVNVGRYLKAIITQGTPDQLPDIADL